MIRFLFILLFSTSVLANDNCTYKTEQVIENGIVVKEVVHKTCTETESLQKQNFLVTWLTDEKYQQSVIFVFIGILENL
jgi:hypothetical protein